MVANPRGALELSTGQFGLAAPGEAPIFLRVNPGLRFHLPEGFSRAGATTLVGQGGPKFMCTVQ